MPLLLEKNYCFYMNCYVTEPVETATSQLVPGAVILIPTRGCMMSCDAVLVSGNTIVNESMLTGDASRSDSSLLVANKTVLNHYKFITYLYFTYTCRSSLSFPWLSVWFLSTFIIPVVILLSQQMFARLTYGNTLSTSFLTSMLVPVAAFIVSTHMPSSFPFFSLTFVLIFSSPAFPETSY